MNSSSMIKHHICTTSLLIILCNSVFISAVPVQERVLVEVYQNGGGSQAHNPFTDLYDHDIDMQTLWGRGDIKFPPHGVGYKPPNPDYELYVEGEGVPELRIGTSEEGYNPEVTTEPGFQFTEGSATRTTEVYQSGGNAPTQHSPVVGSSDSYSTPEPQYQQSSTAGYEQTSRTSTPYHPTQTTRRSVPSTTTTETSYGHDGTGQQQPLPHAVPSCPDTFQAYDQHTGTCYHLATQGPCKGNQWWVLDEITHQPTCAHRPCPPFFAQSPQTGECIISEEAKNLGLCGDSERLVNDAYGKARCQCRIHAYRYEDGVCYPTYQRGPCNPGFYYLYNDVTRQPMCEENPCVQDNLVQVDGQCYQLGDTCGEFGDKNIFINPHNGVIGCYDFFRLPIEQTKV